MKVRCQRLDQEGKQCNNIARFKDHYHGDSEIYPYSDPKTDTKWVIVFLCKTHLQTSIESENFEGYIKDEDVVKK